MCNTPNPIVEALGLRAAVGNCLDCARKATLTCELCGVGPFCVQHLLMHCVIHVLPSWRLSDFAVAAFSLVGPPGGRVVGL
jgi:hypothetical protein